MPEYLSPGVYVEEISTGPKPIEGVSTSTAGFVGRTERGPTGPRLVTSWLAFQRWFGSYVEPRKSFLPYAVEGFFQNGGKRAFIARVVASGSTPASRSFDAGGGGLLAEAIGPGDWGKNLLLRIGNGSRAEPGEDSSPLFALTVLYYKDGVPETFLDPTHRANLPSSYYREPSVWEDYDNLTYESGASNNVLTVVNATSRLLRLSWTGEPARPENVDFGDTAEVDLATRVADTKLRLQARGPGAWGNELRARVNEGGSTGAVTVEIRRGEKTVETFSDLDAEEIAGAVNTSALVRARFISQAAESQLAAARQAVADAEAAVAAAQGAALTAARKVLAEKRQELAEALQAARQDAKPALPNTRSTFASLSGGGREPFMTGGPTPDEGVPTPGDFAGRGDVPPPERTGLAGLEAIDEISILVAPDEVNPGIRNSFQITQTVLNQCERLKDRFAVLSVARGQGSVQDIYPVRDTSYGALYYPWIRIFDHRTQDTLLVPPSGHVAGIYARSDTERGVHKAPANEVVRGIVTRDIDHQRGPLEYKLSRGEHDILNPRGINVIRDFRSDRRGIRVWGARTMSSDGEWKYVNVRRLFLFLEESIDEGTQWVVFEPNEETTWERVVRSVANFLRRVWRDGALMGTTQDEAFFVRCDRNTMTQDDIDNGRLICYIGVAPVKPAEFVIFRISQKTIEATQ